MTTDLARRAGLMVFGCWVAGCDYATPHLEQWEAHTLKHSDAEIEAAEALARDWLDGGYVVDLNASRPADPLLNWSA